MSEGAILTSAMGNLSPNSNSPLIQSGTNPIGAQPLTDQQVEIDPVCRHP